MTESKHNHFIDRRTQEHKNSGLATQVLFFYDEVTKKKQTRRIVSGIAVTTEGHLVVAKATCSDKDQFVKSHGRMVVEKRICGEAKKNRYVLSPIPSTAETFAECCSRVYSSKFPDDECGRKRAYNVGRVFEFYLEDLERRAAEIEEV